MQKLQHAQWPRTRQFVGETGKITSVIGEGGNHSLTELIMMNDSSDKCRKFFPLIHEYFGDVRLF